MRYMALYMAPAATIAEMMKSATDADMKKEMEAWMAWADRNKTALVEMGAPLGKTKTVSASGVKDTHNEITGYSIVEADSADAAVKAFDGHPHLKMKGATIDVIEYVKLPGM